MMLPVDTPEFWKQRIADSRKYGDIHHSVYISNSTLWKSIEETHKKILEPYKDKFVLDAGCGYGRCAPWFKQYTGVDLSPDLLEVARKDHPLKAFYELDLKDLNKFSDKFFDVAFCISIKGMIIGNLGPKAWEPVEKELLRVAQEVLILEYENPEIFTVLR